MHPRGRLLGDRYRLDSVLAGGGMGRVWRAQDTLLQRPVAVKILRSEFTGDPAFLGRFRAEAQHAAQLGHPSIAAVHDYGETVAPDTGEPVAYLVMELVEGEPLSAVLARHGRLELPAALRLLRQTAAALAVAHAAGVVHRDVKPGNLLVTPDGDVKITDFGIARAAERRHKTETGTLKGKYGYMSPEQVSGADVDARSDLFSVGILLAEMVMARRLFTSTNDLDILLMVRDARLDRLHKYASEFPVELRVMTVRALQRRAEDRWQSAAQFRDALDDWI
jgi:eukaryotic-like serine/threonine-protein kinase